MNKVIIIFAVLILLMFIAKRRIDSKNSENVIFTGKILMGISSFCLIILLISVFILPHININKI